MADELVRIKIEDKVGSGIAGVVVRVFDESDVLQAQGITSLGPTPAKGIFETVLSGSALPGTLYTVQASRDLPIIRTRAQIRVDS